MGGSMTTNSQKQLLRMETYAKFPYLIVVKYKDEDDVSHEEYFVNKDEDVIYQEQTYQACYFQVVPPTKSNSGLSDGRITFSTIDQSWIQRVRSAVGRITIEFIACIDYSAIETSNYIEEIEKTKFTLIKSSWNDTEIQFTMMYDDRMNLVVPSDVCNNINTPALV